MTLNGRQARQFAEAMLSGFPRRGDLEYLLMIGLGVNLDAIAGEGSLLKQVNETLVWAQSNGRLDELMAAIVQERPQNPSVSQLAIDFAVWKAQAAAPPGPAEESVNITQLRRALTDAFSAEELQALCADVEQMLEHKGVTLKVDLETVGGASKPAQVLNLIQYLQRRGQLEALIAAAREARPGLL